MSNNSTHQVSYDAATSTIIVTDLQVNQPAVTQEALRWSTGNRGAAVTGSDLEGHDLAPFVIQALTVGATAINAAGGAQDTYNLEQLIRDVGHRTTEASQRAAESTAKVTTATADAMDKATTTARKSLAESSEASKKSISETVSSARKDLRDELTRLFGGEDPEFVARLQPVLDDFTAKLTKRTDEHTSSMFEKATKALNPDDPTSPIAKQMAAFDKRHTELVEQSAKQNDELKTKVSELTKAIEVQRAAAAATKAAANVTPIKGASYEDNAGAVLAALATGFGDEYIATGTTTGAIPYCKKGDGVLSIADSGAKVVFEMTNSSAQKRGWGDYLDEAERNRGAAASLGLVPTVEENDGHRVRTIGSRRIVMAFDPETDDQSLLHTVICLLRAASVAASTRDDDGEVETARERIGEALDALGRLDEIQKVAGQIKKSGDKVATQADGLQTTLNRLLLQAQTALAGTKLTPIDGEKTTGVA
ncbi:hypothetical protein ACQBJO_06780 [Janibacter sp. G349]|uniref:Fis family transcriptional regulator n=1 Tax=Janibacter sp. G349 TaxID=3405424 RepID=UPI003B79388A